MSTEPLSGVHINNYGSIGQTPSTDSDSKESSSPASVALLAKNMKIQFRNLSPEQRKNYIKAMSCRGMNKASQVFRDSARSACGTLSGIQLSGFLNVKTQQGSDGWIGTYFNCDSVIVDKLTDLPITGPAVSLKKTIDNLLLVPIDTMTYSAAAAWFLAHTFNPRIQRYLSTKEDIFMRRVLEEQYGNIEIKKESDIVKPTAAEISYLIEYVMPLLFDASQIALFLRFVQKVGNKLTLSGDTRSPPIIFNEPPLYVWMQFGVMDSVLEMISGEDPVSMTTLYLLLACGVACYGIQAWCNFHHDLQTKETKYNSPDEMSDPVSEEEPTPPL